jgi:hypothetical protein
LNDNKYTSDLLHILESRYSVESAGMTTGEWICANTTHRSKPFSFKGYEFQRAIADDLHPELDCIKISQVGLSEIQQRKALALSVRNPGIVGIFTLPNEGMYRKFYQSRIKPLLEQDQVFAAREGDVRSMSLIQIGQSFLHVANATESSATSISADFVFTDEVDLSDQKMLALLSSRVQNSSYKIKQRFSTPTWTGYGIDATYSISDQREYFCRCHACRHHQIPLFNRNFVRLDGLPDSGELIELDDATILGLDTGSARIVCERCGADLDLDDPNREWVASHPSRVNGRGYRVRPFTTGRLGVQYIFNQMLAYRRRDFVRGFVNTVLGEPFTDGNARLSEEAIRANMLTPAVPEVSKGTDVFVGIDMGQVCHMVLGRPGPDESVMPFEFRQVRVNDLLAEVKIIQENYNLIGGSCDRHPYTPTADELMKQTDGRIVPIEYRGQKEFNPVKAPDGEEILYWQANRTQIIDEVAKLVRTKKLPMAGYGAHGGLLIEHLRDMVREEDPEKPAVWTKLNGNDHYFHALAFLVASVRLPGVLAAYQKQEVRSTIALMGLNLQSVGMFGGQKLRKSAGSLY